MECFLEQARLLADACGAGADAETLVRLEAWLRDIGGLPAIGSDEIPVVGLGSQGRRVGRLLAACHAGRVRTQLISGPADVAACLGRSRCHRPMECFWVLCMDAQSRLMDRVEVARGTLTACLVHPREVFAPALARRAASVVVAHNHPSGFPEPSLEDRALTERLVAAGDLLGVPMLDHVIVAGPRWWSWADSGPRAP
ncbi:MAG: JAB domain-containing protein [Myxococcota bacterium]